MRKIFRKTNIPNPLIRTQKYQWVRNVSFSENFGYVLNGWPLTCRGAFNPEKREMTLICEKINLWVALYYHCIDDLSWRAEQNFRTIIFPNNSGCLFLPFMSNGWSYKSSRRKRKTLQWNILFVLLLANLQFLKIVIL